MSLAAERSSARSTLFPANTRGTLPASRHTSGIQYSSRDFHASSRVTSQTRSTACAPFAALSCTPAYPFCPSTSHTVMTRSMPCPAFGTTMSFFVTFVPIVARYSSPNWSRTNRRTRDVLPTAASPRRTTFTFIAPTANRAPVLPDISTFAGGYRDFWNREGRIRGEGDSNPRALSRTGLATLRPTRLGDPRSGLLKLVCK